MLKEALASHRMFAVSLLDDAQITATNPEPPHPFTCVGRITHHVELEDGTSQLIIEGLRRARVLKVERTQPYPRLTIAAVVDDVAESADTVREVARILSYSEKIIESLGPEAQPILLRLHNLANQPGALADTVAGHLIADSEIRQNLLECLSVEKRLKSVADQLARLDTARIIADLDKNSPQGLN